MVPYAHSGFEFGTFEFLTERWILVCEGRLCKQGVVELDPLLLTHSTIHRYTDLVRISLSPIGCPATVAGNCLDFWFFWKGIKAMNIDVECFDVILAEDMPESVESLIKVAKI
jgi:hypothetical protein